MRTVDLVLAVPADLEARTGFAVELGPFLGLPDEPRRSIEAVMSHGLPAGGKLDAVVELEAGNELGWPMECCQANVLDAAGKVVEVRIGAFYKFNEWVTHALCRGPAARAEASRPVLLGVLAGGRPRWQSATVIAAIEELWT